MGGRLRTARMVALGALAVDALALALVGVAGWLFGFASRVEWGAAIGIAGLAVIALGAAMVGGAWEGREVAMGYAASVSPASMSQRARLAMRDVGGAYAWFLAMLAAAAPLLIAAWVLTAGEL